MVKKGAMRDFVEVEDNFSGLSSKIAREVLVKEIRVRGYHHRLYQLVHPAAAAPLAILVI
jgi:hypothetical protein